MLERCPRLRVIAKYGVGIDNVDLEACRARSVKVLWTPGVNRLSVAEMTLGFMLALCRNLYRASILLKRGCWEKSGGCELSGKTVGVIGVGSIGKELVRLLAPFRCRILVNDIIDQDEYYRAHGLEQVSKETLFRESDVVTIHTPLTPLTRGLINAATLGLMKPTACLVNTARGPVVVQDDLKEALTKGTISGAAIDVYEEEPPDDGTFLDLPSLFSTPHIGGSSREAGPWGCGAARTTMSP